MYAQLAGILRQQITAGLYPPGAALPAEGEIGRLFDVSRVSVRRALALLRHEGLITTERGRTASVRAQPERTFVDLTPVDRLIARMPSLEQAQHLHAPVGVPVLEIHREDGSVETYSADRYGAQGATNRPSLPYNRDTTGRRGTAMTSPNRHKP